ncbi:MAG: type I methionyl aminopeptidase [Candidatus Pacebacteria bacterium]|nr:type I methionyl aminopeptidase [Candidatus Paceibacterota bacterium]
MILKTDKEIVVMREGGRILAEIIEKTKQKTVVGVTTKYLNDYAEDLIKKAGGKPSFKGYNGFPAGLCISVNDCIVHGVPSDYTIKDGDIVSLDGGFFYKGFHSDMAITIPVGEVSGDTLRLIRETKKSLKRGIKKSKIGNTLGDVGNTISRHAEKSGFFICEGLCGHGIGAEVHEPPQVLNTGKRRKGIPLQKGMVYCIEPMLAVGTSETKEEKDGIKTADNSLSAHFEHMIAITQKGPKILTKL